MIAFGLTIAPFYEAQRGELPGNRRDLGVNDARGKCRGPDDRLA